MSASPSITSNTTNGQQAPPPQSQSQSPPTTIPKGKTPLKILMLHGYTQSGALFSSKTKALSKLLLKGLSPPPYNRHPVLIYPTAPLRLRASDIPGYDVTTAAADEEEAESDSWAWFRKDEATGTYSGFEAGMSAIAAAVADAGGVDGVCGFSQGGASAALVAAALEHPYRSPSPSSEDPAWLTALRAANHHRPLSFCVVYSGFFAPPATNLSWLYTPPISTPTLHFLGSLDTVVEESRSTGLVERCVEPRVVVHPGGHYVPVAKEWAMALVGWLRERCQKEKEEGGG
ncbi:serine hydrolase FSH [Hypoxylon fragiforme]|uniref:serine hydrolase FSH n=1 Tax=Hypoxylon fragiforme TaxID=63214 RepID=UPI0020C5D909|nr:serine hydrolase FSH [Hypoxylon fragiforme]KAI2604842.1 serine hydrolase FSH [Hypoxylon fragiforme]